MQGSIVRFISQDDGATAIEYSLIASLIFLVILVAVTAMATQVTDMWNTIAVHV